MKSNLKCEAARRHTEHGVENCSYRLAKCPAKAVSRLDEIAKQFSDRANEVSNEALSYVHQLALMHSFYPALDGKMARNKKFFHSAIRRLNQNEERVDINKNIRFNFARLGFFLATKMVEGEVQKIADSDWNPEVQAAMVMVEELVEKSKRGKQAGIWNLAFDSVLNEKLNTEPEKFTQPSVIEEFYWRFMHHLYQLDVKDEVLSPEDLGSFSQFLVRMLTRFKYKNAEGITNKEASRFLSILDNECISLLVLSVAVGSIAEQLQDKAEFQVLSNADKQTMFASIKRDFMGLAHFWSKQFANESENNGLRSTMLASEKFGTIFPEFLRFDFDALEVSIDGTKMSTEPLEPELFKTHSGCPIAFVAGKSEDGKSLGGNFLARQIDFMIDIFAEHYLELKEYEDQETIWFASEMSPIDAEIYDMLISLNSLPFFSSIASCSGHLSTADIVEGNAPEGKYFCTDGHLWFGVSSSPEAQAFMQDLKDLINRYNNQVGLRLEAEEGNGYSLYFLYEGEPSEISRTMTKATPLFEIDKARGEDKLAVFQSFWQELVELGYKYKPQNVEAEEGLKQDLNRAMEGMRPKAAINAGIHFSRP